jgi:hypothetical protein
MTRDDACVYLQRKYGLTAYDARDLLTRATQRTTGMASRPRTRPGEKTVWATHMTTQNGTFIIEEE